MATSDYHKAYMDEYYIKVLKPKRMKAFREDGRICPACGKVMKKYVYFTNGDVSIKVHKKQCRKDLAYHLAGVKEIPRLKRMRNLSHSKLKPYGKK